MNKEFSIVLGGPLYRFYLRSSLARPALELCKRRIIVVTMFTWLPLLVLSIFYGVAFSGVKLPFIFDLEVSARFIGALGLLIAAEYVAHFRVREIILQFIERDLIAPEYKPVFDSYIDAAIKLRDSVIVELVLLIVVYTWAALYWKEYSTIDGSTWYANLVRGKFELNLAGYWYFFVSLPIFQFILLRWYFRIFVWYRLLWQVSGLPLGLNSLHPDRAGGLGFLAGSISSLALFLIAHTLLFAAMVTNRIWHEGAYLLDFKIEILGMIGFLTVLVLAPMAFYIIPMARAKRIGTINYSILASHYVNQFRDKWINNNPDSTTVLGAADIQSLADLGNSFEVTRDMGIMPCTLRPVLQIVFICSLPFLPLILTLIPIEAIVKGVVRVFV